MFQTKVFGQRRLALLRCLALFALLAGCGPEPRAVNSGEVPPRWPTDRIETVFPPPLEGWTVGRLRVTETPLSGGSSAATAGVGSVRLKAVRRHYSGERWIETTIDTFNKRDAGNIQIVAANSGNEELIAGLEKRGIKLARYGERFGFTMQEGKNAGRAIKVGRMGVVLLECAYADCGRDLDTMIERLDFVAIVEFVDFDHRR